MAMEQTTNRVRGRMLISRFSSRQGGGSGWQGLLALMTAGLLLLITGCTSDGGQGGFTSQRRSGGRVEELHLITVPVALKMDTVPGADGFAVKVFAGNTVKPKPFAITTGTLEILMYDGMMNKDSTVPPVARKTWSFTVSELRKHEFKSSIGVGYQFTLTWGEAKPTAKRITIVARHRDRDQRTVLSAPTVIAVGDS